ncbi:MAG: hypothetical protein E7420_08735 [Ruminococcaceae bacterium]|nr:hypothetical protein [Oscillospiraceae bacterium]
MDKKMICSLLPETAAEPLTRWARRIAWEDLGGDFTIFQRERVEVAPEIGILMGPEDRERRAKATRKVWAASCHCTACGEDFFTGWGGSAGREYAIFVLTGEDGATYDGWCEAGMDDVQIWAEEERFPCPWCNKETRLIHSGKLRNGRTYAAQIASVERIGPAGEYTALVYWLMRRRLDEYGIEDVSIRPRMAVVLDARGNRWRFSHSKLREFCEKPTDKWEHRNFDDPEQMKFYSWGSGPARNTVGAYWYDVVPDLSGSTGEKTGLAEYVKAGGEYPAVYLGLWKAHPNVENLVKAGWTSFISDAVGSRVYSALQYGGRALSCDIEDVDWEERKPNRMLRMGKQEFQMAAAYHWNERAVTAWMDFERLYGARASAIVFQDWTIRHGLQDVQLLQGMEIDGWEEFDLYKVMRYLDKQESLPLHTRAQTFIDYREMLDIQCAEAAPDNILLWPPDLRAAHDRLATSIEIDRKDELSIKFKEIKQLYAPLEWTDGVYRIVVPASNKELVEEGNKLRHCVGGYGDKHCNGSPVFFVRKYRTPLRSYFTLNENLSGELPKRIQLHGYGNEWAHGKRLKIPQEVEAFVVRWEREVLQPWHIEQRKNQSQSETEKKKRRKTKAA